MGRDFGYKPKPEYLNIDMVWAVSHDGISVISVAIEHENGDLNDVLGDRGSQKDELQKLMDTEAYLKVLMFYDSSVIFDNKFSYISEKISSAKIKIPEESYLFITPVLRENYIEVFANSFDQWETGRLGKL